MGGRCRLEQQEMPIWAKGIPLKHRQKLRAPSVWPEHLPTGKFARMRVLFVMLFQWPADLGQRMKRKVSVASTPIVTATSVVTPGLNGTQKSPLRWLDAHRGT